MQSIGISRKAKLKYLTTIYKRDLNADNYLYRKKGYIRAVKISAVIFILIAVSVMPVFAAEEYKQCKTAVMYVEEGNKLIQSEPAKAEALFREALRLCPESANASYNLGISLYNQSKNSEAVEVLKEMLNENPDHTDAMRMLAYILVKENIDSARGKMLAENILRINPKDEESKKIIMLALTESLPAVPLTDKKAVAKPTTPAAAGKSKVDINIPVTNIKNSNAIAVVIGNKEYQDKDIPSVDFAVNDADAVKKYLVNVLGYREGNIIYEENASKAKFEAIFGTRDSYAGRLYNYLKKGKSDIFIYYTGHGALAPRTKQGFFASDADSNVINLCTGISMFEIASLRSQ